LCGSRQLCSARTWRRDHCDNGRQVLCDFPEKGQGGPLTWLFRAFVGPIRNQVCFSFAFWALHDPSVRISVYSDAVFVIVMVVDVVGCCSFVVISCYLLWLHYHFWSLSVVLGLGCMVVLCVFLYIYSLILWSSFLVLGSFLKLSSIIIKLRAKLQSRKGYILTSHHIVHVSVWRKDTFWGVCCPSAILCCFPTQQEVVF
jgi:hypothetical protein